MEDKIIKYGQKFGDVTLSSTRVSETSISYINNKPAKSCSGSSVQFDIRISKGNKFGCSTITDEKKWKDAVNHAARMMKFSTGLEHDVVLAEKETIKKINLFSRRVSNLGFSKLYEMMEEMISGVDDSLKVPQAEISKMDSVSGFYNSLGVGVREKKTLLSASIEVNEGKINSYDFDLGRKIFRTRKIGQNASDICLSKKNPRKIKSFKGDVLFDPFAISEIITTVLPNHICADEIQAGRSRFSEKMGDKIFSEQFSIKDDGSIPFGKFSSCVDGEGIASRKTSIISKGVLKNFLFDLYTAKKEKTSSTGNSGGFKTIPKVECTNLAISPGKLSNDEMFSEIKKGICARDIVGSHMINVTTGDCSVGVDTAFYVEKGDKKFPIKQAMVNFNLFDVLSNVECIGKTLCKKSEVISPMIIFKNVQVIG